MPFIEIVHSTDALQSLVSQWEGLDCPSPMQSPLWMLNWWHAFKKPSDQLNVLVVRDEHAQLMGLVPWYARQRLAAGRTLRFLGDGAVCSDFQSVLTRRGCLEQVTTALVQWLSTGQQPWDLLDLEGCSLGDPFVPMFQQAMAARGHVTHWQPTFNTWRLDLQGGWPALLDRFSRTQRAQTRNFINRFDKGGYQLRFASEHVSHVDHYIEQTMRLHQACWQTQGEPGCFANASFRKFFQDAMRDMLLYGSAEIALLERDGKTVAANAWLISERTGFCYQAGRDPAENPNRVGRILHAACLRHHVECGLVACDFLRGDELYKSQWRAQPTGCGRLRIVARAQLPQLRHSLWLTCREIKSLFTAQTYQPQT